MVERESIFIAHILRTNLYGIRGCVHEVVTVVGSVSTAQDPHPRRSRKCQRRLRARRREVVMVAAGAGPCAHAVVAVMMVMPVVAMTTVALCVRVGRGFRRRRPL